MEVMEAYLVVGILLAEACLWASTRRGREYGAVSYLMTVAAWPWFLAEALLRRAG